MNRIQVATACVALLSPLACGGGGGGAAPNPAPGPQASTLIYTDPTGSGYRLVANPALSTASRLTLDLVGPAGQAGQGVAFILQTDATKVSWTQPSGSSSLVQNLAFALGSTPQAVVGLVKANGALHGAVFQKAGSVSLGQPLLRVSLTLAPGAVSTGTPTTFAFTTGNGLSDSGAIAPISIAIGTLVAK